MPIDKILIMCERQHTLSVSFLDNEITVAGSDRISGMENLHQEAKAQYHNLKKNNKVSCIVYQSRFIINL